MENEKQKSITVYLDKLFNFLEKDRTTVFTAFLLVLCYAFIRASVEIFLLAEKNTTTGSYFLSSIHNWAHVLAFFTGVFLSGTLIISFLAKVKIRKAVNVVTFGFWLIIIPPLLDYFVFGIRSIEAYFYAPLTEVPKNLTNLFSQYSTTWGLRIQGVIISALAMFYVAFRSKSVVRTILTPIALFGVMALFGSLDIIPLTGELFNPPPEVLDISGERVKPFVGPQLFMAEMLFILSVFLVFIYIDLSNKKIFPYLVKRIRPEFVLYPVIILSLGLFSARFLDVTDPNDFSIAVLVVLIAVFGWLFANFIFLYYEADSDRGKGLKILTKSQLKHSTGVLAVITLGLSFLSGFIPLLLTIVCMLFIWLYSRISLRSKNIHIAALIFAFCSFLGFLVGYFSVTHFNRFAFGNYEIWYPATRTSLSVNSIAVGIAVFLVAIMVYLFLPGTSKSSKYGSGIGKSKGKLALVAVIFIGIVSFLTIFIISPIFEDFISNTWSLILAYVLWLFFLSFIIISLLVHLKNSKILPSLWKNLRPFRTIHFVLMVCIGLVVANSMDFFDANNVPYIITAVFLLVFLWQYTVMINDIFDIEIDRLSNIGRPLIAGVLTKKQYTYMVVSMAVLSGVFSLLLGPIIFSLALICLILGTIYSVPPLRIRDRIWSSIIIGMGSAFAFFIGYFTPDFDGAMVGITSNAILISLLILSALSMGPILTDLKDYEGDKKVGVKSIYTVFGLQKGKKMASILIPIMFLVPAIILYGVVDVVIFIVVGAVAALLFYKKGDFRAVFGCYFIILIYCLLRFADLLSWAI